MKTYNYSTFIGDLQAGLTVGFVLIPAAIAYSSLAGVPPISGLLSATFPPIIYSLIGVGGQLSVGPEALTSVMVGLITSSYPEGDAGLVASSVGFISGIIALLLALLQAGFIQNLLSGYLLTGFVLGVSGLVMVEQLPNLLGLPRVADLESASTIVKSIAYVKVFPSATLNTLPLTFACLFLLFASLWLKKKSILPAAFPDILILIIVCTGLSFAYDFKGRGIATLGPFSNTIPLPQFPSTILTWDFVTRNLSLAVTITLVGFYESQTVIREFGRQFNYFPSGDRVLFSLGVVNVVNSLLGGYSAFGSLPRSKIQATTAKTPIASMISGLVVLAVVLSLNNVIKYLPKSTLASIVFVAAYRLIEWEQIAYIFKMRNVGEITKFLATYLFTIGFGVSTGIILCLILSVIVIVRRATGLDAAVLGELKTGDHGQDIKYIDVSLHPEARVKEGLLILSIRGTLQFFNASKLLRRIEMLTDAVEKLAQEEEEFTEAHENPAECTLAQFDPQQEMSQDFVFISSSSSGAADKAGPTKMVLVLDFSELHELDSSGVWTLLEVVENQDRYLVYMTGVSAYHSAIMEKGGLLSKLGPGRLFKDPSELIEHLERSSI